MIQIKIERIGDDERWISTYKTKNELIKMYNDKRIRDTRYINNPGKSRAWCAKIIIAKIGETEIIKREFIKPNISYLEANSKGSRGVFAFYNLENNFIYEVCSPLNWKHDDHFFCKVIDNNLIVINKGDIFKCQELE